MLQYATGVSNQTYGCSIDIFPSTALSLNHYPQKIKLVKTKKRVYGYRQLSHISHLVFPCFQHSLALQSFQFRPLPPALQSPQPFLPVLIYNSFHPFMLHLYSTPALKLAEWSLQVPQFSSNLVPWVKLSRFGSTLLVRSTPKNHLVVFRWQNYLHCFRKVWCFGLKENLPVSDI